jgi:hypothetical protein
VHWSLSQGEESLEYEQDNQEEFVDALYMKKLDHGLSSIQLVDLILASITPVKKVRNRVPDSQQALRVFVRWLVH